MNTQALLKNTDLQRIAQEGSAIYEKIKAQYEPAHKGEFLAIDVDSEDVYLAPTSAEAVVHGKVHHPESIFFIVKIGFDAAETMAHLYSKTNV